MIRNSTAKSVLTYRSGNEHALVVSRNLELQTPRSRLERVASA